MPQRPYLIVSADFVSTGGMDVANLALALHLAREGRPTHVVGYRAAEELAAHRNVVFHQVRKPLNSYALGAPLLGIAGLRQRVAMAGTGVVAVVNGGNCPLSSINWVHYVHAAYEPVIGLNGWHQAKTLALHRVNMATERVALRAAKLVVTNSDRTRRDVIEHVGVPADRVRTIYFGVDSERFRPRSAEERLGARDAIGGDRAGLGRDAGAQRPIVAFVGALGDRRKGFDVVFDAWRSLCSTSSWDANLVVAGSGAELDAWRARAVADRIHDRVHFLGFRRDIPLVLAACDALVAPARYEAYGVGVHEALCCGLPALVSSRAGIAERYPASLRGLLIEDPSSAAAVVASLCHWRDNAVQLRSEALVFSESLRARSWGDMARDIVDLGDRLDGS